MPLTINATIIDPPYCRMPVLRVVIDPLFPDIGVLNQAVATLAAGGIVAFPTDTLYGLAVDPRNEPAVDRLFRVKGRSSDHALPLVAADFAQAQQVGVLPPLARRLATRFWPGPLTLVVRATRGLAPSVHADSGKVAVRVPAHVVARELARLVEHPITSTSANRSGASPPADADAVVSMLGEDIDLVLDAGETTGGLPSTIVDVTGAPMRLVRAGAVPWERVVELLKSEG